MNINHFLDEQTVFPRLSAGGKEELLGMMIDALREKLEPDELEKIRRAVLEREQIMSTGVGKGLAIPHGKAPGISNNYAVFAILEHPVEYEAIDREPVSMVFLLVGPQGSNSLHIKTLSYISRLMNNVDFREKLKGCGTAREILEVFKDGEGSFGSP